VVNLLVKSIASPLLDPIGNTILAPPVCGRWGVRLHGDRSRKQIALTFDDGPVVGGTEDVLEVLAEFRVCATFFCLGINMQHHPELALRAIEEGHVIGNHSMEHSRIDGISLRDRRHFLDSERVFAEVIGKVPRMYRSPWGWTSPWEVQRLRKHGLEPIGWDVYPEDDIPPVPPAEIIVDRVLRNVRSGSIILMHDGYAHADRHDVPQTIEALNRMIPPLLDEGYEFVTVPEALGMEAYKGPLSEARVG
jgi:peptidoglycan/xylan/chitin deacetylase (PgdA/CDA1 family)